MKKWILFFLSLIFIPTAKAQNISDTLTWAAFKSIVKTYHPVVLQAKLLDDLSKAKKIKAIGGFDPKLSANFDRKIYDETEYYQFLTPEIKLPLWYGIELKGSYSKAEGAYINPENKIPKEGLSYAGISFQLGNGLLIDPRRAAIRQAKIYTEANQNQQKQILNDLFKDAGETYLDWQNKYKTLGLYEQVNKLAKERFIAVKNGFLGGDLAAIDTVEAFQNLQQREMQLQQAKLDLQFARYELSNFLWLDNQQLVDPQKLNIIPDTVLNIPEAVYTDISSHPKFLSYQYKIKDLEIEKRLKAEGLKPDLSVSLGFLNAGRNPLQNLNSAYWNDHNKVSFGFSFPLTLSKARGDLAEIKVKLKQTTLEQDLIKLQLHNKQLQNKAEYESLLKQFKLIDDQLNAAQKLLQGEEQKFKLGDSSLFKINARETKLIEVNEKYLSIEAKLNKTKLKIYWTNGNLDQLF